MILYDGAPRLTQALGDGKLGELTFKDLVNEGVVEWIDAEEEDLYIAPRPFVLPEVVPEGNEYAGDQ